MCFCRGVFCLCWVGMRYTFMVGNLLVYAIVLAPVLWHLWVDLGSGNANFYWATCLVLAAAQVRPSFARLVRFWDHVGGMVE